MSGFMALDGAIMVLDFSLDGLGHGRFVENDRDGAADIRRGSPSNAKSLSLRTLAPMLELIRAPISHIHLTNLNPW